MYTANKVNGIGEVIAQDANVITVYFSETDKTTKYPVAYAPVMYATIEEAEASFDVKDSAETMTAIYNGNVEADAIAKSNRGASEWLAEKNRENAMKNLPSSLK